MIGRKPKLSAEQQAEVRALVRAGARYRSVADEYGVSEGTIARIVGVRKAIGAPPVRPGPCVICKTTGLTLRFVLTRHPARTRSSRGAGALDLCETCWRRHAAIHQRPRRRGLTGARIISGNVGVDRSDREMAESRVAGPRERTDGQRKLAQADAVSARKLRQRG